MGFCPDGDDVSEPGLNDRIIFVPGKNTKPPPDQHRAMLWRCLSEGVSRAGAPHDMEILDHIFSVVAWNPIYYDAYRDPDLDLPAIERLLEKQAPDAGDIAEARSWRRRVSWLLYSIGDMFPGLINIIGDPWIKETVRETQRYFGNIDGIASEVRELVKQRLRNMLFNAKRVLLVGHSLGSVIAYDALWEMCHQERLAGKVDFLTIGSPLGLRFVQKRLLGAGLEPGMRYPKNIRRWINVASVGELTALDPVFANDFRAMVELGFIPEIEDHVKNVYNHYRDENGLNVHRSYGYLVNPVVGKVIVDWLRVASAGIHRL